MRIKSSHNPNSRAFPPKAKANSLQVQGNHIHSRIKAYRYFDESGHKKAASRISGMRLYRNRKLATRSNSWSDSRRRVGIYPFASTLRNQMDQLKNILGFLSTSK